MTTGVHAARVARVGARMGAVVRAWPPQVRIAVRWVLIVVAVTGGFWQTWAGLARETDAGGLVGYVFAVPGLAVIAAGGISRRRSRELPIHDRQTDIIVAVITAGLAVAIKAFLIPRYVDEYQLLYLDVLAAWLFVVAAAIMLFGLRPVARFTAAWVVLLTMFPLPYRILVIGLGGSKVAAGLIALALGVASTAVAVARSARRALLGALSTLMIGATALLALNHFRPSAPLLLYQYLGLITSAAVSALFLTVTVYREPPAASTRSRTPIAATDAWAAVPLVALVAVALAAITPPTSPTAITSVRTVYPGTAAMQMPAGWHSIGTHHYHWVTRFFGPGATLNRHDIQADHPNPEWDELLRPRQVVIDTLTVTQSVALEVYPPTVLYELASIPRISDPQPVRITPQLTANLYSIVDDQLLLTWTALTWTWRTPTATQRITMIAVDNHEPGAPFPAPANALISNLNTLATILFRGNTATTNTTSDYKDRDMLTTLARNLATTNLAHPA